MLHPSARMLSLFLFLLSPYLGIQDATKARLKVPLASLPRTWVVGTINQMLEGYFWKFLTQPIHEAKLSDQHRHRHKLEECEVGFLAAESILLHCIHCAPRHLVVEGRLKRAAQVDILCVVSPLSFLLPFPGNSQSKFLEAATGIQLQQTKAKATREFRNVDEVIAIGSPFFFLASRGPARATTLQQSV